MRSKEQERYSRGGCKLDEESKDGVVELAKGEEKWTRRKGRDFL